MATVIIITCTYLWLGTLIASGYSPPEGKADIIDRFCIAVLWVPLMIIGVFLDD